MRKPIEATDAPAAPWVLILCFAVAGCVSSRGGTVARLAPQSPVATSIQRHYTYDLKVDSDVGDDAKLSTMTQEALRVTFQSAGVDAGPVGSFADPDAKLSIVLVADGSVPAQLVSGMISGATMAIIPAYAEVRLSMNAEVTSRAGQSRRYQYADRLTTWIQLFLLPFSNSEERVVRELVDDMVRSLARDMDRDGLLPARTA